MQEWKKETREKIYRIYPDIEELSKERLIDLIVMLQMNIDLKDEMLEKHKENK